MSGRIGEGVLLRGGGKYFAGFLVVVFAEGKWVCRPVCGELCARIFGRGF